MKESKLRKGGKLKSNHNDADNDGALNEFRLCLNRPQWMDFDKCC